MNKLLVVIIAATGIMLSACDEALRKENAALLAENKELEDSLIAANVKIRLLQETYGINPDVVSDKNQKGDSLTNEQKEKLNKEREAALKKLKKKTDDVQGITWYENPYFKHYDNMNRASLYIGQSKSSVWLRLKLSYEGDSWIFFDRAFISYDGNTREIFFNQYKEKESDHDTRVWEWIDVPVTGEMLSFIRSWVEGKSVKMQLMGKYTKTRTLTNSEIRGLKDVLMAYDALKAQSPY